MTRRGFSLIEVLIAGVVLAIVCVPVGVLLSQSTRGVQSTDRAREARYLLARVLEKVEAADFVTLWDNFGAGLQPPSGLPRVPESGTALRDTVFAAGKDPLYLGSELQEALAQGGWTATLAFRFLTKPEVEQTDRVKSASGILHLQAGVVRLKIAGNGLEQKIQEILYCPMILGRPGLMLKQCPAVNPQLRDLRFGNYP